ncbi:P1 family peptidase [Alicyclobacillus tolerans]|uniref:P1 family peptidase n=1 Tax=Alicyclobacillus tolerans TaxID=90970 RepID=UPI001F32497F|nr:P1 family peptidase [Alicyclobacillus tolerans]MCF8565322.1 P1 family peptidase [Alicyclobacillus tolerans]
MKEVHTIVDVPGIRVGHAQDDAALTGCTVVLMDAPAVCGVDVRGSAPGTRETDLLSPTNLVSEVHAICLSGGSAFGLDAATGVMRYLEEQGIGLNTTFAVVPIVPAAVLYDLAIGDGRVRPDANMGYRAAQAASSSPVLQGNFGAGTGATVGKMAGFDRAMKSGLGSAAISLPNGLVIGAMVAVNAVGEVRNPKNGTVIAGPLDDEGRFLDSTRVLAAQSFAPIPPGSNTTIAVVASNANLNKTQANKVAQMAHDGLARTIYPVHTMYDGDTVFAAATGGIDASVDAVGALSAEVLAQAVIRAVQFASSAGGLTAYCDLKRPVR